MNPFSNSLLALLTPSPQISFAANKAENTADASFPPGLGFTCRMSVVPPPMSRFIYG